METVSVRKRGWWRRLFAFAGPAYLISVGYMDPGNWATDIEGGSRFGYSLIWVLLLSNLMAVLLQTLSARLGVVTGYDLAQGCRREYPRPITYVGWVLAEIAIAATDLAEALGTVLGLNLLFGLPLLWGCLVTALDTFLLLGIQRLGIRKMEAFILMLIGTIASCFLIEIFLSKPDWGGRGLRFCPSLAAGRLVCCHRNHRGNSDAPQSLPALLAGADAGDCSNSYGEVRSLSLQSDRFRHCLECRLSGQRRNSRHGRG